MIAFAIYSTVVKLGVVDLISFIFKKKHYINYMLSYCKKKR